MSAQASPDTAGSRIDGIIEEVWGLQDTTVVPLRLRREILGALGFELRSTRCRAPGEDAWISPPGVASSLDATLWVLEQVWPGCWYMLARGRTRDEEPLCAAMLFAEGQIDPKDPLASGEHDFDDAAALTIAMLELRKLVVRAS